ncbi:MAG: hypothetical protein ACW960_04550 [Candidatus Thorarchaeota archaeon]
MSDDESPREIASIVWTAISGSIKIVAGLLGAYYVNARWSVRSSKRRFQKSLVKHGLPVDYAKELASTYAAAGQDILSIRKMVSMIGKMRDLE